MFSKPIQTLIDFFLKFPGVGPRQAGRFVFYLLREDKERVRALAEAMAKLHDDVKLCAQCFKTFDANPSTQLGASHNTSAAGLCEFCRNPKRNAQQVLVVEKEADLENIERTHKYDGLYHILGGTINPLDSQAPTRLHIKELFERIRKLAASGQEVDPVRSKSPEATAVPPAAERTSNGVEMILATNPTAEGEATALYLERVFAPLKNQYAGLKLSRLGRGLSTGSELEYSDDITIANALENRK